ncbi:hypothetical protein PROPJV5_1411 [Propionibacterium ruminifibrarum]|uniref:Uncharacterized protein n=1 Tax=Propionibacterium ruminifibrarum TaxID=1962131 RepID=A0A375I0S8_9ACTN|nr:hypothetical protein [Propionibacterium ruminifibrarum]SPF68416.1 hypothetical protein PROPJV5_1411 [Propionibacterium ruminifibrarum]
MSAPRQSGADGAGAAHDWASRPARPSDGWRPGQTPHTGVPAPAGPAGTPQPAQLIAIGALVLTLLIGAMTAAIVADRSALRTAERAAQEAARTYLTAIAEGDAETARGYLEVDDDSLLTDEVLRVSNELAPMTDITVGEVTRDRRIVTHQWVRVGYRVGGVEVSALLSVSRSDDPTIFNASELSLHGSPDVGITVNGAIPATSSPTVFPGTYELASNNEYLDVTGEPIAAIDPTEYFYDSLGTENEVVASEAGVRMFREKVVAAAQECLASTRLDAGCGIDVPRYPEGLSECEEIREDSVHRRQDSSQAVLLETVTPRFKPFEPNALWAPFIDLGRVDITVTCRVGDTWTNREITSHGRWRFFGSPSIDLTDPDLAVAWNA